MEWRGASTSVDGLEIQYREAGTPGALPVLLLHGWASSSHMWDPLSKHLSSSVHLVAPDLPGHGDSDKPEADWYSIAAFRTIVIGLGNRLDLARPVVIGHSMGGTIAIDIAHKSPQWPRGIVVINPVVEGRDLRFSTGRNNLLLGPLLRFGRRVWPALSEMINRLPEALYRNDNGPSRRMHRDLARTTADSALGSIFAVSRHGLGDGISQLEMPVLVVVGTRDLTVPPRQGRSAAEAIDTAQLVELHTGHHVVDQEPVPLARALDRFLRERVSD